MQRRIYIYQFELSSEIVDLFSNLGSFFSVEKFEDDILTIIDTDYFNPEPLDFDAIRELIIQDFSKDITIFIEPYLEEEFFLRENVDCFIKDLNNGTNYFEDIIAYVVVKGKEPLKNKITKYISDCVNSEVIHTVREFIDNNMNSSSTSKKLFMHRNTLNYRIDNFIELTKVNVKTFKGANAIYMLYHF